MGELRVSVVVMSSCVCLKSWRLMPEAFKKEKIRNATKTWFNKQPTAQLETREAGLKGGKLIDLYLHLS